MWSKKYEISNVDDVPYHDFASFLREKKLIFFSSNSLHILDTDSFTNILSIPDTSSCPLYLEKKQIVIRREENVLTSIDFLSGEESLKFKSRFNENSHLIYLYDDVVADIKQEFKNWELVKEEGNISKLDGTILHKWVGNLKVLFSNKNYLVVADSKNELTFLSKSRGTVEWKTIIDNAISLKFQQESQNLFIFSNDSLLVTIDKKNGAVKWEHKKARAQSFVVNGGNQIIAINNEAITFLNEVNGNVDAIFKIPSDLTLEGHLTHLADGIIYFINISETAEIWAYDYENNSYYNVITIRSEEAGTRSILSKIVVIEDRIYLLDTLGTISIYEREQL